MCGSRCRSTMNGIKSIRCTAVSCKVWRLAGVSRAGVHGRELEMRARERNVLSRRGPTGYCVHNLDNKCLNFVLFVISVPTQDTHMSRSCSHTVYHTYRTEAAPGQGITYSNPVTANARRAALTSLSTTPRTQITITNEDAGAGGCSCACSSGRGGARLSGVSVASRIATGSRQIKNPILECAVEDGVVCFKQGKAGRSRRLGQNHQRHALAADLFLVILVWPETH